MLGALGDSANRRLKIKFARMNFDFFGNLYGPESRGGMCSIREPKLAALRK